MEYRKAVEILKAKVGLISNREELIEFKKGGLADLATDFHRIKKIEFSSRLDGYFHITNEDVKPRIQLDVERVVARGDFLKLEKEAKDDRFSLLGNEGLFYRFVLRTLEDKYGIFSFHACGLLNEKTRQFYIICGGAGSGKTVFILEGIQEGLKIFSTEMVHFRIEAGHRLRFYKGSLLDNTRIGTLKYSFPEAYKMLDIELPEVEDEWGRKITIDLSRHQTASNYLDDPEIVVVFPHIEEEKNDSTVTKIEDKRLLCKLLFDNLSEKIGETILLYEQVPMTGLDTPSSSRKRLRAVNEFVRCVRLKKAVKVIAGTRNCLKGVKE